VRVLGQHLRLRHWPGPRPRRCGGAAGRPAGGSSG
jgi:hypothetical protein